MGYVNDFSVFSKSSIHLGLFESANLIRLPLRLVREPLAHKEIAPTKRFTSQKREPSAFVPFYSVSSLVARYANRRSRAARDTLHPSRMCQPHWRSYEICKGLKYRRALRGGRVACCGGKIEPASGWESALVRRIRSRNNAPVSSGSRPLQVSRATGGHNGRDLAQCSVNEFHLPSLGGKSKKRLCCVKMCTASEKIPRPACPSEKKEKPLSGEQLRL